MLEFTICYIESSAFIIGGLDYSLNPLGKVFELSRECGLIPHSNLHTPRYKFAYTVMSDKLYIIGGFNKFTSIASVEVFDLTTEDWEEVDSLIVPRAGATASTVNNDFIIILGGTSSTCVFILEIEKYCAKQRKWELGKVKMPYGIIGGVSIVVPDLEYLLVFGGYCDGKEGDCVLSLFIPRLEWNHNLPKLTSECHDSVNFPLLYDDIGRIVHLFNGTQEPIQHLCYSLNILYDDISSGQEVSHLTLAM